MINPLVQDARGVAGEGGREEPQQWRKWEGGKVSGRVGKPPRQAEKTFTPKLHKKRARDARSTCKCLMKPAFLLHYELSFPVALALSLPSPRAGASEAGAMRGERDQG